MTNQRTERLRPGRTPGVRGSGYRRGAWLGLCLVGLLAGVSQAWAAEVVEVRVGRHPDFTRIVFELDRAAGYRIERSDPSAKNSELIISLEAGSIPRRIQSSKSFIEQVVVEPNGTRSVARIRLARGGLKLKEMILASPPRIVLDVISEQDAVTRSAATSAATVSPTRSAAATTAKPTPIPTPTATKPVASTTPSPSPTLAANATATANATARPGAAAKPSMPTSSPTPGTKLLATTANAASSNNKPSPPSSASVPSTPPPSAASGSDVVAATPGGDPSSAPDEWNDGGASGAATGAGAAANEAGALAGTPGGAAEGTSDALPTAGEQAPKARPMMVKSSPDDEGGGLMTWALAGLGLAAVAFVGLVVARRRRAASDLDGDGDEQAPSPFGDEVGDAMPSTSEASNPFAALSGAGSVTAPAAAANTLSPSRAADKKQEKKPESSLFDDAEEKTMENMEVISRSQVNESLGGAMPMMGGASDELQQMFREMQRRVAALEGRIDELVDARDRLERQVAAQTEELRVQRAAIARTQRAVRNLARPEDAGDDEPTEPALRDPN